MVQPLLGTAVHEVNGYLPSHVRVFTDENNAFKPQILAEALHLELVSWIRSKLYALKETEQTEELYKYLLIVQCNALNSILPGMFQTIADYTGNCFCRTTCSGRAASLSR